MDEDLVSLRIDGSVAKVRFNRPEQENRITYEMMHELIDTLEAVSDSGADLLVLSGEGADFCAGRDQGEDLSDIPWEDVINSIFDANERLAEFDGISIAAVQGKAIGFGCGLAVQSDITLASETAEFGFDEIKHGIAPKIVMSYIETYVNRKTALDLILTGRTVGAEKAATLGLATRVLPENGFTGHVDTMVNILADYDEQALTEIKFFLREIETVDPDDRRDLVVDRMT